MHRSFEVDYFIICDKENNPILRLLPKIEFQSSNLNPSLLGLRLLFTIN
jgi:hypothetical protein